MNSHFSFIKKRVTALLVLVLLSFNIMATTPALPVKEVVEAVTDPAKNATEDKIDDTGTEETVEAPKPAAKPMIKAVQLATYTTNEKILASMLPKTELIWLESDSGKILALQREYLAAKEKGVAIFVSELSTPVNYNVDIEPIRTTINQYGWTSLAINPPSLTLLNNVKKETTKDDIASDSAMTNVDGTAYTDALVERILSAQEWALRRSQTNILIIQGRQVAYLTSALIKQHLQPFKAIIIVNADHAVSSKNPKEYPANIDQLSIMMSKIKTPMLDIYDIKNSRTKAQMLKRKRLSIKAGQKKYRQHLKVSYSENEQLSKVIYGWLKALDKKPKS